MDYGKIIAERANKTVYRDGDKTIKVFAENYSKADIVNEVNNQAIIEELGMTVPQVLEISLRDGRWIVVSDFIEGESLETLMKKYPEKQDEYLALFVDLQTKIQSKTTDRLTRLKDKLNTQITQCDLPATMRYDFHMKLETMPKHHKICHGDFNPSNIIIGKDGKAYILDWSHATQGNASGDAAMTYLLFKLGGNEELAEKYLSLFCKKTGTKDEYIRKWIPLVAASHSTECAENEKPLLIKWAEGYTD
ncbi:MAG: phosphotransferase [Acutalibacteraceae bacterium]